MTQTNSFKIIAPRFTLPALALSLLALANGCTISAFDDLPDSSPRSSGGRSSSGGSSSDDSSSGGSSKFEEPPVEEVEFEGLFSQTFSWMEVDAWVEKVVTRTQYMSEVEVTFRVENRYYSVGELEPGYWDLILPDGERVHQSSPTGYRFDPEEEGRIVLAYRVEKPVDFTEAYLEIQGSYGDYEPFIVPFDEPMERPNELVIDSLVGQVYEHTIEAGFERRITIEKAEVTMNSGNDHAARGKKFVRISGKCRILDAPANDVLLGGDLFLRVNGDPVDYDAKESELSNVGQEDPFAYRFEIPIETSMFDVVVLTAKVPDERVVIPIDLADAVPSPHPEPVGN